MCLNLLETCTTHNTATLGFYVLILGPRRQGDGQRVNLFLMYHKERMGQRLWSCFYCFFRNMVIALKELSIRGDFRTTVEYLIKLLETDHFQNNQIDTGWLDKLIVEKVQVLRWTRSLNVLFYDESSLMLCSCNESSLIV